MIHSIDQLNRKIQLGKFPKRIVSLVPSQTELLSDLGLSAEVVGITKFCIHPESWFRTKTRIGGTKSIRTKVISALDPDLIIGNKEENELSQLAPLMEKYPVWISDVHTLPEALFMIRELGRITARASQGNDLAERISANFEKLYRTINYGFDKRAAYLIWKKPWMAAGGNTFIHDMLCRCGLINVFGGRERYPEITLDELRKNSPDLILLSSEPFPFKQKDADELSSSFREKSIRLVDGEFFSWYGSRLLQAPDYFHTFLERIGSAL